ncbi:MAG: glycosyltransferase family 4 protein [Candidatus Aenigmarchaeota archaeon]|nr:glycosyltransferase family 4 protein [Candidatus Aenigmarchaeota archaeon]
MKVGLLTFIGSRYIKYVGVGRYENSLVPELRKLGVEIEFIPVNQSEIGIHPVLNRMWVLALQYLSKSEVIKNFDLFHASSQFTATRYTDIITVHDLIGLKEMQRLRQSMNILKRGLWKACIPFIKRSRYIISVSNVTKRDLIEMLHVPEGKITVIHNGIDHKQFYPEQDKEFKESIGEKPVLLYVGELRSYKNVHLVLKSMKVLREKHNMDVKLILIGKESRVSKEWWEKWMPFIIENNLDVKWLKNVGDGLLRKYYSNVDLFVWPSLAEGFGLPPLEAMACGTNVVALDNDINREIMDDLASFSENEPEKFALAIKLAIENLKNHGELIDHAKQFSWEKTAKKTKEVYERSR